MASEEPDVAKATRHEGGRLKLSLVFLLALAFSLLSFIQFLVVVLSHGTVDARSILQANSTYLLWLRRSFAFAVFLVFYNLGRRFDFRSDYLRLAILTLAGLLAGAIPQLVSLEVTSTTSGVVTGFALGGIGLGNTVSVLAGVFQDFAFPFAGLALAFLREDYLRASLWPSSSTGERRLLSPQVLVVGFAIATTAYLAYGITDAIGSQLPQSGQFAYLHSALVTFSPYDGFAYDFFYPLLFFIAFYFLGKRLDTRGEGMVAFATSAFAAGVLGFLVGIPLEYYVRALAAPQGQPFPPFPIGLPFVADGLVQGIYVLAFGFVAASLGLVRNMENPINQDRRVAAYLLAAVIVLFALSIVLGVSPGSSGIVTTITTATSTTALPA